MSGGVKIRIGGRWGIYDFINFCYGQVSKLLTPVVRGNVLKVRRRSIRECTWGKDEGGFHEGTHHPIVDAWELKRLEVSQKSARTSQKPREYTLLDECC